MNEQIKCLRKSLNLTQQGLAGRLGVKRNTVAQWEIGVNNLSDQIIRAVCREFNVSEEWLRTGEGEMFVPEPEFDLVEYVKRHGMTDLETEILKAYLELAPDVRENLLQHFKERLTRPAETSVTLPAHPEVDAQEEERAQWEREARAEAEEVYRQVLEEKKAEAGSSTSPRGTSGSKMA